MFTFHLAKSKLNFHAFDCERKCSIVFQLSQLIPFQLFHRVSIFKMADVQPQPQSQQKKKSLMWTFFERNGKTCQCKICGKTIAFCGNTSNMLSHITSLHKDQLKTSSSNQPKIDLFTVSPFKQDNLNRELSIFLATSCLPLNLSENPAFRRFMSVATPRFKVPVAKTIKKNYIKPLNEQVRQKIIEEAKDKKFQSSFNLNQESFLGFTCHYLKDDIKRNVTLECVPFDVSHDNHNIREMVM